MINQPATLNEKLQVLYFKVTDIWKRFCEEHTLLLDKTFEEYSLLLASNVDAIEELMIEKNDILSRINFLENARTRVIGELNTLLKENNQKEIESVSELISVMGAYESVNNAHHLRRFNALLIDLIEKLQTQNKKNQLFLNKAINNLREIREDALGVKSYSTYNNKGLSKRAAR